MLPCYKRPRACPQVNVSRKERGFALLTGKFHYRERVKNSGDVGYQNRHCCWWGEFANHGQLFESLWLAQVNDTFFKVDILFSKR